MLAFSLPQFLSTRFVRSFRSSVDSEKGILNVKIRSWTIEPTGLAGPHYSVFCFKAEADSPLSYFLIISLVRLLPCLLLVVRRRIRDVTCVVLVRQPAERETSTTRTRSLAVLVRYGTCWSFLFVLSEDEFSCTRVSSGGGGGGGLNEQQRHHPQ